MEREKKELGGGPNSFRGGRKLYSVKTRVGNWLEDWSDSGGFTAPAYISMAQSQMLEGSGKKPVYFGTGLPRPPDKRWDTKKTFGPDKLAGADNWESISESFHKGGASNKVKGFSCDKQLPKGVGDEQALQEYRKRWTQESEENRDAHFATTNNSMLNSGVVPKYQMRETRKLPGLPLCIERLLLKVYERSPNRGVQELSAFLKGRAAGRQGRLTVPAFKQALKDFDVAVSLYDTDRLIPFLDSSNEGSIEVESLLIILRGPFPEARSAQVLEVFSRLLARAKAEKDVLTVEHIRALFDPKSDHDCVEGKVTKEQSTERFVARWAPYQTEGSVTQESFLLFYHDLSLALASDKLFNNVVLSTWGFKIAPPLDKAPPKAT